MTAAVLMNLGFAGGMKPIEMDANALIAKFQDRELVAFRGMHKMKILTIHGSRSNPASNKLRAPVNWVHWLNDGDSIASSTWTVEDQNSSVLTISDESNTSTATVCYVTALENNQELHLHNTIVTDGAVHGITETVTRSFLVKTAITY